MLTRKRLEAGGLVHSYKQERARHCRLRFEALDQVTKWIAGRRALLESRLDRLGGGAAAHSACRRNVLLPRQQYPDVAKRVPQTSVPNPPLRG
jgi:hypothetical protein